MVLYIIAMFPAMACQNCNAANYDAYSHAILFQMRFLDVVPNTQMTSVACFTMILCRVERRYVAISLIEFFYTVPV